MVAVEYSGQTRYKTATNEVQIFTNPVTTALCKKDSWFASQIEDAIRDGRMLQADKKRSHESPSGVWSQCPESLWSSDFTTNIEQFKQNIKRFLPKEKQIRKSWGTVKESEETTKKSDRGDGTSNRDLLANAFEGIPQNSDEYKMIQEYKGRIKILNEYEEKLAKLNAEIREIRFTEGKYDAKKLRELEAEAKKVAENINRADKKLLNIVSAVYTIRNEKAKRGYDLVQIGNMPTLYRKLFGLRGDVYVSNTHLYQNMVSRATAETEGRFNPNASADYHELGKE